MKTPGLPVTGTARFAVALLLTLILGLPTCALADDAKVLARVDGDAITMDDLDYALTEMEAVRGESGSADIDPSEVLERLIQNRLLEQEGYRIGADRKPAVLNQYEDFIQHKSMMALLDSVSSTVPELADAELDAMLGPPSTMDRIAHILVGDAMTAQALLDSLYDGVPFEDLEVRHSADTTFAGEGGDLGWSGQGTLIPEFENVIRPLAVGQVGGPVQTNEGWHLLKLTDRRTERLGDSDKMRAAVYDAEMQKRVMAHAREYVASLKSKHGVKVDEELLKSLDYGSEDPAVQNELRDSDEILATIGKHPLTVGGLTFRIRFQYFHGIEGKENAGQIRDQVFDEWLTESLLRYEALQQGYQHKPEIARAAESYKRDLIREEVLSLVLESPREAEPGELEEYYEAHRDEFTPKPRVKVDGVFLGSRDAAVEFKKGLEGGARVSWLADRSPGVVDAKPDVYADWLAPDVLGGLGVDPVKGAVVGPFVLREAWTVVKIVDVQKVEPTPFEKCKDKVAAAVKNEHRRQALHQALERLKAQADISVEKDAEKRIAGRIESWLAG